MCNHNVKHSVGIRTLHIQAVVQTKPWYGMEGKCKDNGQFLEPDFEYKTKLRITFYLECQSLPVTIDLNCMYVNIKSTKYRLLYNT